MLATLTYYIAMGSCFLISTVGVTYYLYPYWVMDMGVQVSWKILKTYHTIKDNIFAEEQQDDEEWKDEVDVVVHNVKENKTEDKITIYRSPITDISFLKKKINNQTYCRRITDENHDIKDVSFNIISKPLIQVELKQDNTSIEIQDELKYFYLEGNEILDKIFLKWYVKYWFHIDLKEDYKLQIIDSNVNIITMDPTQSILFNSDSYSVLTKKEE